MAWSLSAERSLRSGLPPGVTQPLGPWAVNRMLRRAVLVFGLRVVDGSYSVKDIQLVLQHTPPGTAYRAFRKQWDRRLRRCRGTREP